MNASNAGVIAATTGTLSVALGAVSDWPQTIASIGAVATVGLTTAFGAVFLFDQLLQKRRKVWDEFNKSSLTAQLAESLVNQEKMRTTLHDINALSHTAGLENTELRIQLSEISKRLYETDIALNKTNVQLREALTQLAESQADRTELRNRLAEYEAKQVDTATRLDRLEGTK